MKCASEAQVLQLAPGRCPRQHTLTHPAGSRPNAALLLMRPVHCILLSLPCRQHIGLTLGAHAINAASVRAADAAPGGACSAIMSFLGPEARCHGAGQAGGRAGTVWSHERRIILGVAGPAPPADVLPNSSSTQAALPAPPQATSNEGLAQQPPAPAAILSAGTDCTLAGWTFARCNDVDIFGHPATLYFTVSGSNLTVGLK